MATPPAGTGAGTATRPAGQGQPNVNPATGLVSPIQPVTPNPTTGGVPFNQGAVTPNQSGFTPGQTDATGGTTTGSGTNNGTGTTNNGTTNTGTGTTPAPNSESGQAVTPARPSFDSSGAIRTPQGSTNSAASPSTPGGSGTPTNSSASNNASQLSTDGLLHGLADVRVSNLSNLNGGDVVNISTSFNKVQIQALEHSLKANAGAQSNAQIMTQMLQQRGLMARDQVVVGFTGGKVYVASASEVR